MQKIIALVALSVVILGVVHAAQQEITSVSAWTPPKLVEQINDEFGKIDDNFDELYAADTATDLLTSMLTRETASAGAKLELKEGTNNGTDGFTIAAPNSLAAARTITLADENYDLGDIKSKADAALQPITWTVGVVTSSLSAKVTIESSQAAAQFITGWISEAAGGAGVGTNVTSMVIDSAGVKIAGGGNTDAYAIFTTHTDGTAVFDVTIKAPQAGLFFNVVQNNNVVVSQTFDITED